MIEVKDVVQIALGLAGWGLAAYQYWRNELNKRPLVIVSTDGFKRGDKGFGGGIVVRNRAPWDIRVETLRVRHPRGAMMVIPGPGLRSPDGSVGPPSPERRLERDLGWKLPAYASGDFPSKSHWFQVEFPAGSDPSHALLDLVITESRSTRSVKRRTTRHKVHSVNK